MNDSVLITGASTGIGAAAATALAKEGWRVYAGVRSAHDASALAAASANLTPVLLDVTDERQIHDAFETIASVEPHLDALINNAGIALGGPLEYFPIDEFKRLFETNLFGALAVTQKFLPMLRQAQSPRLIFVGSIQGRLAMPYIAPYSASKFAMRAVADALRVELAPKVTVSLIEPASVKTPIWRKGRENGEAMRGRIPPDAPEHYFDAIEAVLQQTEYQERNGMPAERVTEAIRHALSGRPRAAYLVGASARAGSILALLPIAWRDRIMRRSFR